jgi:serine/threonine protein kinase
VDEEHFDIISRLLDGDCHINETLIRHLADRLPANFGTTNIKSFASFLWSMLQHDPQKRKSAAELLYHPFLTEHVSEKGKHDGGMESSGQ